MSTQSLQQAIDLTRKMSDQVDRSQWKAFAESESQRQVLIEAYFRDVTEPDAEQVALLHLLNEGIVQKVSSARNQVGQEIQGLRRSSQATKAYLDNSRS